jgi:hypothetical protein
MNSKQISIRLPGILLGVGLVVVGIITGCTPAGTWTRPGITQAVFAGDMADCRRQARVSNQPVPFGEGDGLERSDRRERLIRKCMEDKGYRFLTQ